jgi:hypothetical protein
MPGYLADTCVIIDPINDRGNRREFIRDLLQPGDTLGYCTINPIEVYTGTRPGEERVTDLFFEKLLRLCRTLQSMGLFRSSGASEDRRTAASGFRAEAKSRLKGGCRQDCLPHLGHRQFQLHF